MLQSPQSCLSSTNLTVVAAVRTIISFPCQRFSLFETGSCHRFRERASTLFLFEVIG
jgi:hypothetical protein